MKDMRELFRRAARFIPGGVNSPVRAFGYTGGDPVFVQRAQGACLYDTAGREYVDYVCSWGAAILGHAHPAVVEAVQRQAALGLSYGTPTELETELAACICRHVPSVEKVRMVNSGTEAAMSALRLARGYTGRDRIVKFAGCYHGHADSLLVKAGSGAMTLGVPDSLGVPAILAGLTTVVPYNDLEACREAFRASGEEIAAAIVEPIAGNMGCVLPQPGFLEGLRSLCNEYASLLIFDEVMTGFRVALGGAQARCGVRPDLTVLGKAIGGGLPVGAFGGRAGIMDRIAPDGPVYQAGTLSGNPAAMAAGLATLERVAAPGFYERLERVSRDLTDGLARCASEADVPLVTHAAGGMFGLFFSRETAIGDFTQVAACDGRRFRRFFHAMLQRGIYLAPSPYEAGFVSAAHDSAHVERTLEAARQALQIASENAG